MACKLVLVMNYGKLVLVFLSLPVIQVLPEPGVILNWIVESFVTFSMFFKKCFNLRARRKVSLVSLKSAFKNG